MSQVDELAAAWDEERRRADAAERRERELREALERIVEAKAPTWPRHVELLRDIARQALASHPDDQGER